MEKYIFFDVDGTLVPFGKKMTQSTFASLQKAKSLGHKILLATGRAPAEIDPSLFDFDFDGGVYSAGAFVEYCGKVLHKSYFNLSEVGFIFSYARENSIDLLIQTPEGSFLTSQFKKTLKNLFMTSFGRQLAIANLKEETSLKQRPDITKVIIHSHKKTITEIRKDLAPYFNIVDNTMGVPVDFTAEIMQKGVNKATGIACFERLLSLNHSQIIAIGDGVNDKEMIAYAAKGIAMENSTEEVKKIADFVTTSVEKDGIKKALEYCGII